MTASPITTPLPAILSPFEAMRRVGALGRGATFTYWRGDIFYQLQGGNHRNIRVLTEAEKLSLAALRDAVYDLYARRIGSPLQYRWGEHDYEYVFQRGAS